jgi:membrane fusion protein (multidrug efflux system)
MSATLNDRDLDLPAKPAIARRRWRHGLLAAVAAGAIAGGIWLGVDWWRTGRFMQSTDDAYVGGDVTAMAAHVAGYIEAVAVADNQHVTAGQLLIRLDRRDYAAAVAHDRAAVEARRASLSSLQAQQLEQQAAIRQMQADLSSRVAQAAFTEQDAGRYRTLARTSAGSTQDAQRAHSLDLQARSAVDAATAGLEQAKQHLTVLDSDVAQAQAMIVAAQSDLRAAELNLGWTEIRSPIDGYVGNRAAQIGAYAAPGSYLISVIPAAGLWVDANFKEDQLARMQPGQAATVVADVLPDHSFRAHVVSIAPGTGSVFSVIPPENATGNFTKIVQRVPVRVRLDADDPALRKLRPGLSAVVDVDTRPQDAAP